MTFAMPARPTTTVPPQSAASTPVPFPVARLAAALIAAGGGSALAAGLVAGLATSTFDGRSLALGVGLVLAATGLGIGLLAASGPRAVFGWASLVMGASIARLMVSLALALAINIVVEPAAPVFWSAFLAGSVAVLTVETIMARAALLKLTVAKPRSESA